jgi:hypothetical protein
LPVFASQIFTALWLNLPVAICIVSGIEFTFSQQILIRPRTVSALSASHTLTVPSLHPLVTCTLVFRSSANDFLRFDVPQSHFPWKLPAATILAFGDHF